MTDDTFNKSVILDLESFLIKYVSADGKYELQNGNSGLSNFDYYSRNEYEQQFLKIWEKLKELGLVRKGIKDIEDSDFFKYSPYKSLTKDQGVVLDKILYFLTGYLKKGLECTLLVEGGAGTGKTIMAVYLLKLLCDLKNHSPASAEQHVSLHSVFRRYMLPWHRRYESYKRQANWNHIPGSHFSRIRSDPD